MHNPKNTKILIIEDDVIIAEYISEILQEEQFKNIEIQMGRFTSSILN